MKKLDEIEWFGDVWLLIKLLMNYETNDVTQI